MNKYVHKVLITLYFIVNREILMRGLYEKTNGKSFIDWILIDKSLLERKESNIKKVNKSASIKKSSNCIFAT